MRIFLIGYMGAGKTTLGKVLANNMNLAFVDTDNVIESRYQQQISDIFASEGESRFREIEHETLCELTGLDDVVIATGGGLPCFNNNMTTMNKSGITVYLDVSVNELAARLETCKATRPVLQNLSGKLLVDFIRNSIEQRRSYYEQASIRLFANKMSTDKDINKLVDYLELSIRNIQLYNKK